MCPWVFLIHLQPLLLCCVCLARALVCSQRPASLSQSPRVGFLSSLLPQSKKSPSRLSPAQAPPQAQSSAKKDSFSSQVSVGPACLVFIKMYPMPCSQAFFKDSLSLMDLWVFFSGPNSWMCYEMPKSVPLPFFSFPCNPHPPIVSTSDVIVG